MKMSRDGEYEEVPGRDLLGRESLLHRGANSDSLKNRKRTTTEGDDSTDASHDTNHAGIILV